MLYVVGERINTSRKKVQEAVVNKDSTYIQGDVKKQQEAGANFIDVNAGARIGHEKADMEWLLMVIQEVVTIPLCLDSPDPEVLEMAYEMVKDRPMINSISLERERYDAMVPFLKGKDCSVVALCMDDSGMLPFPDSPQNPILWRKTCGKNRGPMGLFVILRLLFKLHSQGEAVNGLTIAPVFP